MVMCGTGSALSEIVPAVPGDFGPSAIVETFEGIAGVSLPLVEWGPEFITPMSELLNPYVLPSGVVYSSNNPEQARVFDYDAPGYSWGPEAWGWGLSWEGGTIHYQTPFPSGAAFFGAYCGQSSSEPVGTVTFTFPWPVRSVGAYVEANLWPENGYDGVVTLEAFDEFGVSLGQVAVVTDGVTSPWEGPPYPNGLDTWIGLGTHDGAFSIYSIAFHGYNVVADDLMFVPVPEPASFLTLALAVICVVRRR
jgi:hypothetical protein